MWRGDVGVLTGTGEYYPGWKVSIEEFFDKRIEARAAVMEKDGRAEFNADDLKAILEPYLSEDQKQAADGEWWLVVPESNGEFLKLHIFKQNGVYVSLEREDR
ncbi:MAG: hypothetical protein GY771_04095 [bacterium]|nr:hypothetical protein [bacterium]